MALGNELVFDGSIESILIHRQEKIWQYFLYNLPHRPCTSIGFGLPLFDNSIVRANQLNITTAAGWLNNQLRFCPFCVVALATNCNL